MQNSELPKVDLTKFTTENYKGILFLVFMHFVTITSWLGHSTTIT